jgi:predicted MPP superfamily phosphohydrolase
MRSAQQNRFLIIVFCLILFTCFKAVELWPAHPPAAVALSILLLLNMLSAMFVFRANPKVYDKIWFRALSWSGSLTMGLWTTFVILTLPVDLVHALIFIFEKISGTRLFLPEIFTQAYEGLAALSLLLVACGFFQVWRGARLVPVNIPLEKLPAGLEGLRIAQISDLHVGATIRKSYVEQVVARTNAAQPDLILMTGDIADGYAAVISRHLQPLKQLKAQYGVYYVTGNHEYYWDPAAILQEISGVGFKILFNENVILDIDGAKLMVAGVTDPAGEYLLEGHKPDAARAITSTQSSDFKILLAHRPGECFAAEVLGFDLQFSGHTHSGQFFPFSLFIGLAHRYSRGLYRHLKMWIHVNPGTGFWGPANRLGVAPEISLITLTTTVHAKGVSI